jgi:hypothetical protein
LALEGTGTAPAEVDYISLHGTGSKANDAADPRGAGRSGRRRPCQLAEDGRPSDRRGRRAVGHGRIARHARRRDPTD